MNFGNFFFSVAAFVVIASSAQAQMMAQAQWGTGQWGGMQQCPYQTSVGQGAVSMNDDLKDIQQQISEAKKTLSQKQAAAKKFDKEVSRAEKDINDALEMDHADFIIQHLSNGFACEEYDIPQESDPAGGSLAAGEEGQRPIKKPVDKKKMSTSPFSRDEWAQYCKPGNVVTSLCDNASYRNEGTRILSDKCKRGISAYKKNYSSSQKMAGEIERLKEDIERLKEQYADAKQTAAEDRQMGLSASTEGGDCPECGLRGNGRGSSMQTDWSSVAANGITAAVAMGLGYSMNKNVTQSNAELGFPTENLYPAWGYGLPYAQAAVYGALSGSTGQGSFGCGGNGGMSAGGAFGYPASMMMGMNGMGGMNTMGGGMYMGGMSPWGMQNPMGMSGMMGMNGMMGGYGSMMNGYGNMMSVGGIMGGMTGYGNMMGMGNMMSGYGTMMNGYGNMGSMMNIGGIMGGMMGYGSLMGNSMMGSMTGSLMSGGLMMGGLMSGGTMMGTDASSMQLYAQYQQQQMAKYSQLSSLQQEMSSLAMRMQMIQSGYYTGYGTGSLNSTYGGATSSSLYNYGSVSSGTGPIPIGISAGGTIYQER